MTQLGMFGDESIEINDTYASKIQTPIYEPKNRKPYTLELFDKMKFARLKAEIMASDVSEDEKEFLVLAATRHIRFNFGLIADFYAHASPEVQALMEQSALIIVDFKSAIENGYVKLAHEIAGQYLEESEEEETPDE